MNWNIRHKFIATPKLSEDGLLYRFRWKTIWVNDIVRDQLKLPTNILNVDDYRALIDADDIKKISTSYKWPYT